MMNRKHKYHLKKLIIHTCNHSLEAYVELFPNLYSVFSGAWIGITWPCSPSCFSWERQNFTDCKSCFFPSLSLSITRFLCIEVLFTSKEGLRSLGRIVEIVCVFVYYHKLVQNIDCDLKKSGCLGDVAVVFHLDEGVREQILNGPLHRSQFSS